MFNLSGSELIFLLLLALIILGPEKLPEAIRKFGKTYAEVKKVSTGFQTELRSAMEEPMREMQETANTLRTAIEGAATEVRTEVTTTVEPLANQTRATFSAAPPAREPAEPAADEPASDQPASDQPGTEPADPGEPATA